MATKNVGFRCEEELIQEFDAFSKLVGADRTTLITMFMKFCVTNQCMPFIPGQQKKYDFSGGEPTYIK